MPLGRLTRAAVLATAGFAAYSQPQPAARPQAETVIKDEPATFRSRVNLIMVPVVVRDKDGKATGNLKIDDFQLSDNGKAQFISKFSVEKPGSRSGPAQAAEPADPTVSPRPAPVVAERFTIYLFDDVHLEFGELARVRDAALHHLDTTLTEVDRAAIFTTSGQGIVDFTDDRNALRQAVLGLRARPLARSPIQECPAMSFYIADVIENHNDQQALQAMTEQTMACDNLSGPGADTAAQSMVHLSARRYLTSGEHESRISLQVVKDAIRRLAAVAGQRVIVLASPGFYTTTSQQPEKSEAIERAIRAGVVINSLDARGLYTDSTFDASNPSPPLAGGIVYSSLRRQEQSVNADVLAELALGTGGGFFQNNNDLEAGFRRLAAAPEYIYMLGFSPQNLKVDGKYHRLKVALKNGKDMQVQGRRGYFAPKEQPSPEETAKAEIEEALFSREEMRDIPITLATQFFKRDDLNARLSVINRIDLRPLHFRKTDDRNCNELTVVTGVFDRNGKFITASRQIITMRLLDTTVAGKLNTPLAVRTGFDVPPGVYSLRVVLRDSEGRLMSAANSAIEIP